MQTNDEIILNSLRNSVSQILSDTQNIILCSTVSASESIQKFIVARGYGEKVKALSLSTGIPESTFSKIKYNKDYKFEHRSLIALLIELNVDFSTSMSILQKAGLSLGNSKEHIVYKVLLEKHDSVDIPTANMLLKENHLKELAGHTRDKPNKKRQNISR